MKKLLSAAAFLLLALSACDDTTDSAGFEVMPQGDNVTTSTAIFSVPTQSAPTGSIYVNTSRCYLGCVVNPALGTRTRSSFLAQFRPIEDYAQPEAADVVSDDDGLPVCDSCQLRMYFTTYFGDSLAPINVRIRELSRTNIMEEGTTYYSDINPADYLDETSRLDIRTAYSIVDPANANSTVSSNYYRVVTLRLPSEYGAGILRAYYDNPSYFTSSYNFIHNVCPGLYVEHTGGVGSMLNVEFSTLDVYYSYHSLTTAGNDTTLVGMTRLSATEEVLQNTVITTDVSDDLLTAANPYTALVAPAGVHTTAVLPIDDILGGEHATDSLNSAQLILSCYNLDGDGALQNILQPPTTILLLPVADRTTFFENGKLPDEVSSFMATYDNGAYSFSNIARLVKYLQNKRETGAGIVDTDTPAERTDKLAAYDAAHPEWNSVAIVPVDAEYTTVSQYYSTNKVLTRLRSALSLSAVLLSGGTGDGAPLLRCVYSHFE